MDNTLDLLRDAAKMQMGKGLDQDSKMMEKVRKKAEERLQANQKKREELEEQLEQLKAQMMMKAVEKLLEGDERGGDSQGTRTDWGDGGA